VDLGVDEGLKHDSAVNLDHVQTVEQSRLVGYVGAVSVAKMRQVCQALAVATGCW
jgi:mRNA interferase MazF